MEIKNKELALKNIQLKEDIDKLTQIQTSLLKDAIKNEYNTVKLINKINDTLDENISILGNALEKTKKIKCLINNSVKKSGRDVLMDKNK